MLVRHSRPRSVESWDRRRTLGLLAASTACIATEILLGWRIMLVPSFLAAVVSLVVMYPHLMEHLAPMRGTGGRSPSTRSS